MDNNSRTDWAGKICPICDSGNLVGWNEPFILRDTVECNSCGAILPRFTSQNAANGYEGFSEE